jgi:hypothetical protein
MHRNVRFLAATLSGLLVAAPAAAQHSSVPVSADSLRASLFTIAADSMGGRETGSPGNFQTAEWVARSWRRDGLQPAGENGTFFQTIPFRHLTVDPASSLHVAGSRLTVGRDILPVSMPATWMADGLATIYGGVATDSTTWLAPGLAEGKIVVVAPSATGQLRALAAASAMSRNPRFAGAAGFFVAAFDTLPPRIVNQLMRGRITTDTASPPGGAVLMLVTTSAASTLLGRPLASAVPGQTGPALAGRILRGFSPLSYPARNVVAILPGSDPALRPTYVSATAHNDHVGFEQPPEEHDSTRAFNRVVRPMGADSRMRPPTSGEAARVQAIRDSLRALRPPKADSVFNGADDDGSGTVLLVELARVLSGGTRPRRSILFVSHAAEERGLLGSQWFTDHPTVPRDSIVAELDMDMVGRGGATDLPGGGPGYLELVGSKRLSTEFGNLIDSIGAREPVRFRFNYEYDAPGHPLQYYCRADHFSYARYGIPSVSISTGEHLDYHQVTDEPQYIDYDQLARVTALVRDVARAVANLDHRPVVDGPRQDPHAPCRQ